MDINLLKPFIEKTWETSALPSLMEYITIPAVSPAFNPEWDKTSYLNDTLELAANWCRTIALENMQIHTSTPQGRTPILLIDIAATHSDDASNVLMYGHLDKQPEASGWDDNKGPWSPVVENNRLYGRGAVDNGYALYAFVIAIKALQEQKIPHPRYLILIETCEESGSLDLAYYLEHYEQLIGVPDLIVCLDSGGGDYDRLWITTSLRGAIVGHLEVRVLTQDIHSGVSGSVASSFRILRQILDRIENAKTGEILLNEFYAAIPENRMAQMKEIVRLTGKDIHRHIPLYEATRPMSEDPLALIINSTWKPSLSYTGADGMPHVDRAANVLREFTKLTLSFRIPPTVDTVLPLKRLKQVIEQNPPYGASISYTPLKHAKGWNMPEMGPALENAIDLAAESCFGKPPCYSGDGGSIPFMTLLSERFPDAKFLITGALSLDSNAHGPNEFLHIGYVKKITLAVAGMIATM